MRCCRRLAAGDEGDGLFVVHRHAPKVARMSLAAAI
jgi:hypothetical protein